MLVLYNTPGKNLFLSRAGRCGMVQDATMTLKSDLHCVYTTRVSLIEDFRSGFHRREGMHKHNKKLQKSSTIVFDLLFDI